ncbi:MAG TPA: hypothetical protein DD640_01560 [Clostridiales bacterium]|nr:hypothetical protein [Clostridiales bacterium]
MSGVPTSERSWQDILGISSAGSLADSLPADSRNCEIIRPGRQMAASLDSIRSILPLPREQLAAPDPVAQAAIAARFRAAATDEAVASLSYQLTSRELQQLFPLLAVTTPRGQSARQLAGRLARAIQIRACPTLYVSGWLLFQQHYPNVRPVAKTLARLGRTLGRRPPVISPQPSAQPSAKTVAQPDPLETPAPITRLAAPDSPWFLLHLLKCITASGLTLLQFMRQYQIHSDLPFGVELIARSFLAGGSASYSDNHRLFGLILRQAAPTVQISLLHHFFQQDGLPAKIRNRCFQQIYRQFGDLAAGNPVWQKLRARDVRIYQEWVKAATLGSHCRKSPQKARLYLRYAPAILRIEPWDENTLLIHFPDFLIADSRVNPHQALYYARPESGGNPFPLAHEKFNPNPADPAIPHRQVEDVIRSNSFQGIVGLPFDPDGIRLTGIFLNLLLGDKTGGQRLQRRRHTGGAAD